ncbi:MAG TPA: hypothetical protein VE843_00335 [Ktedonobacteraceae bacterium]|nr:hypothetical protein [Ktedonobacteraceae bacterium]
MSKNFPFRNSETQSNPITIVPLHVPEVELAEVAAPPAQLVYNNGPLLTAVQVYTIFWDSAWQQSPASDMLNNLNSFFDYILTSSLMDQLAEYSTSGQTIGHGSRIGTTTITTSEPGSTVADTDIQQMLNNGIADNTLPQPDANTLYFVYLPSGVTVTQGGSSSCQAFCGYHDTINGQIFYAVMPYPDCQGCTGGLATFDALTSTSSHELSEAVTDPIPGQGWYDQNNGEIGDICAWKTKQVGNYTVQLEWSHSANSCV